MKGMKRPQVESICLYTVPSLRSLRSLWFNKFLFMTCTRFMVAMQASAIVLGTHAVQIGKHIPGFRPVRRAQFADFAHNRVNSEPVLAGNCGDHGLVP